jgi:hypothetical protein
MTSGTAFVPPLGQPFAITVTWPGNFTVAGVFSGMPFVVIVSVARSAGTPPIITFAEPGAAGATIVAHGTKEGVPGVGSCVHPGRIGVPGISVIRSAGAPPITTVICFGTGFAIPVWCGQVITALTLQIGGTLFPCAKGRRSIAAPNALGNLAAGRPGSDKASRTTT